MDAVSEAREMARVLAPGLPSDRFRVESIEELSFPDASFTVVLASAVLHFARDERQFAGMLTSMWRVLARGGMFFCRLASSIGIESQVRPLADGRFRLPDGTNRYLVDEATLTGWTNRLGGLLLDPLKTTIVHGQRSMTTWVVRKA
jgi:ubiquinone/menaquinone biosynthesis C-methylase UbiE